MAIVELSKPFSKTMNGEPVTELDVDFSKITVKQYIESNKDVNEVELIAYKKLGWYQSRKLIAYATDCIPETLSELPLIPDYKRLERMCFLWATELFRKEIDEKIKFEKISVDQYLAIRSKNTFEDMDTITTKASATTRRDLIACATGKTIQQLEEMPIEEYIPLDIECASFFSELV